MGWFPFFKLNDVINYLNIFLNITFSLLLLIYIINAEGETCTSYSSHYNNVPGTMSDFHGKLIH